VTPAAETGDRALSSSVHDGGWYYLLQYWDYCHHSYEDLYWALTSGGMSNQPRIIVGSFDEVSSFSTYGKLYITKCYHWYYCIFLVFEEHKYFVIGKGYTPIKQWNFGSGSNRVKFSKYGNLLRTGSRYLIYTQHNRPCNSNSFLAGLGNKHWALRVKFDYEYEWFNNVG